MGSELLEKLKVLSSEGPGIKDIPSPGLLRKVAAYVEYLEGLVVEYQGDVMYDVFYESYLEVLQEEHDARIEADRKALLLSRRRV